MKAKIFVFCTILLACSCQSKKTENTQQIPLNLTVLLDLSDRIHQAKNPEQLEKDLEVIHHILNGFEERVQSVGFLGSKDRLNIVFSHAGQDKKETRDINNMLVLDVGSLPFIGRKDSFTAMLKGHRKVIKTMYDDISKSSLEGSANLYGFFKDDYNEIDGYENHIILIADGYLNFSIRKRIENRSSYCLMDELRELENWPEAFESKDYGFLSVGKTFPQTTIQVVGIDPRPGLNEYAILEAYWQDWFDDMQMKSFDFQKGFLDVRITHSTLKQRP